MKSMIKKVYLKVLAFISYEKYARIIGVNMGKECRLLGRPSFGTEPYLITMGDHVSISAGVTFLTHEGAHWVLKGLNPNEYDRTFGLGRINIGNNVYIGYCTTILRSVTIGDNVVVGACSLVNKSLEGNAVYAGVPCRKICTIEEWKKKFLSEMPEYDYDNYKKNRKEEILRIVDSFPQR